eukprot:2179267-Lingulodinium_polyedra.AAC.1
MLRGANAQSAALLSVVRSCKLSSGASAFAAVGKRCGTFLRHPGTASGPLRSRTMAVSHLAP